MSCSQPTFAPLKDAWTSNADLRIGVWDPYPELLQRSDQCVEKFSNGNCAQRAQLDPYGSGTNSYCKQNCGPYRGQDFVQKTMYESYEQTQGLYRPLGAVGLGMKNVTKDVMMKEAYIGAQRPGSYLDLKEVWERQQKYTL